MDLESKNAPEGYRHVLDRTMLDEYLAMDLDGDCQISKNEWIIAHLKLLEKNIDMLQKEGPTSIMKYIKELSDEFDVHDNDGNGNLEFSEYQKMVKNSLFISED